MFSKKCYHTTMTYLIFFIIYGFLGWAIDTTYRTLLSGYFAPGTWIPYFSIIYPIGAFMMLWLYGRLLKDARLWQQFLVFAMAATALEYTGGHIGLLVLDRRLWDYSYMPYNIDGFVDVFHSIGWGLLSLLLVHAIHPHLKQWVTHRRPAATSV